MKFTCESCGAQYMISDEKVGPSGVKVRCKKCGNVIPVRRGAPIPAEAGGDAQAEASGSSADASAPAPGLEVELGEAFDHAFGGTAQPEAQGAPPDAAATQSMGSDDAAKVFADKGPASPASEWYVAIGQAQVGPLPLTEVKKKWEAGDVGPDSLVWRPGMADWLPLTTVPELAGYLAPVPRASSQSARAAEPRMEQAGRMEAPAPTAAEPTWKPAGASALAALASEEIAARAAPAPSPAARPGQGGARSLVDALPDGGGVDPTGAMPLNIKALEANTDEKKLERRSSVARGAEQARHRRSTRSAVIGIIVVGAAAAVGWFYVYPNYIQHPAPKVAVAPPVPVPPPPAAAPAPAAPAPKPAVAVAPPPAPAAAPAAPAPAAKAAAPAAPAPAAKGAKAAKAEKAEAPARKEPARKEATAAAEKPAPAARKQGGLLDFESNDKALDDALGGGGGSPGRSVYVPPARSGGGGGGGGGLPDKVSSGDINAAVAGRIDSLRSCVSAQKAREPDASGTLKMRWVIKGDGSVSGVKCLTPQYAQGAFAKCISGVVSTIKFPQSTTKGQEVTFPFNF